MHRFENWSLIGLVVLYACTGMSSVPFVRSSIFRSELVCVCVFASADCAECLWKRRQPVTLGWCSWFTRTDAHSQPQSTADRCVKTSVSWIKSDLFFNVIKNLKIKMPGWQHMRSISFIVSECCIRTKSCYLTSRNVADRNQNLCWWMHWGSICLN